ncbi:MAG: LysR substrate-binding domain-containing protein [Adlercreutzia equolifaciens]
MLLTPYGEVFYEHVCLALRAIDDGVAAVSARSSASFGTVNLGTTFTTHEYYLPSLIRDFEEAFRQAGHREGVPGFTSYLTEQLHRGTLDVAFCGKRDNEPDIAYFSVKHCELALYVRDDHPLASADTITFAELNEVDLHAYRRGTIGERVAKMLEEADVRSVSRGLRRRCVHGVVSLLQRRQRQSAYAGLAGRPAVQQPAPGARRGHPERFYTVHMAYHKKHVHSRAVADCIDFVKAYPGNDLIGQVLPTAPAE